MVCIIRFWRSIIGIVWGAILGAIVMHFVRQIFDYESTLIRCVVFGIPAIVGFISGVIERWWDDFWIIIVFPLLSLILVAVILLVIYFIDMVQEDTLNLMWLVLLVGIVGLLVTPAYKVIVILIKE